MRSRNHLLGIVNAADEKSAEAAAIAEFKIGADMRRRLIGGRMMTEGPILWRAVKCARCRDTYWVCETPDNVPWEGEHACGCGGAGMPCPNRNPSDKDHPPRPPRGFQRDESLDDD